MAKGKTLNPADAHRKAQRRKELKKNKVGRQKNRDFALVKKDTTELENEVAELEELGEKATSVQKARLSEVKAELARVMAKKDEYVNEHPDQKGLVYRWRKNKGKEAVDGQQNGENGKSAKKTRRLFHEHGSKKGLPRHPERSIYYDPVMNPYGVPPPGMPYAERPLLPGEIDSDAEENNVEDNASDDSDDIPLPVGPRPGTADDSPSDEEDGDDDIPLPPGPPPPPPDSNTQISSPPPLPPGPPPLPPFNPYQQSLPNASMFPPSPMHSFIPPPPPPMHLVPGAPPPPPIFNPYGAPPPPPGFFPRTRGPKSVSAMQDPLAGAPHLTFQERRESRQGGSSSLPSHPSLPPRPVTSAAPASTSASGASATISAEPELRDFKKESTAFVPAALKRKKAGTSKGVNAAPMVGADDDTEVEETKPGSKPDLLGALRDKLGPVAPAGAAASEEVAAKRRRMESDVKGQGKKQGNDDYNKFLAEMGDLLAAPREG